MHPNKCAICRHRQGNHCSFYNGLCSELQDDSQFNSCGISFDDAHLEIEAKTRKATAKKEAKLKIENMKEKV